MNTNDKYNLERFITAQNNNRVGAYNNILASISAGEKIGKILWHIFPRYVDLGRNQRAHFFGITELNEAIEYLAHPILGQRLREISKALLINKEKPIRNYLNENEIEQILSCMTLFDWISPNDIFAEVLNQFFSGNRCVVTLGCIEKDTRTLSLDLLSETTDQSIIDCMVNEYFPEYGNIVANQLDYAYLKKENAAFKAMTYQTNVLNEDLLCAVKAILDRNIADKGKTVLLASVISPKRGVRGTIKNCMALIALLSSYNGDDWYHSPFWCTSNTKTGLNLTFVIAYLT